jgi:two-component system cell cycle response regulator DivK
MNKTILVVEDHPEERAIFSTYLRFVGGRLLTAPHGREGLRMAREHRPDLILLDLSMPVMDGWETIRRLREDAATSWIPVIAITAHHLEWERLEEAGFCGYLEKPIAPYRVLEEVERCLGSLHEDPEAPRNTSRPGFLSGGEPHAMGSRGANFA